MGVKIIRIDTDDDSCYQPLNNIICCRTPLLLYHEYRHYIQHKLLGNFFILIIILSKLIPYISILILMLNSMSDQHNTNSLNDLLNSDLITWTLIICLVVGSIHNFFELDANVFAYKRFKRKYDVESWKYLCIAQMTYIITYLFIPLITFIII